MLKLFPGRFWIGLVVLFVVYSAYHLSIEDNATWRTLPNLYRQSMNIGVIFCVYLPGTWFLGRLPQQWLSSLWHIIHISLISLLSLIWGWHIFIERLPEGFLHLGLSVHEFLISPLLYLGTGIAGIIARVNNPQDQ